MKLRLIYGDVPFWRAEVSRLALYLGGVEFEDYRPTWAQIRELKAMGFLPFGQVPALEVDGRVIAQTGAIARFCGKQAGLYPRYDDFAAAKIDEVIDAATDITNRVSPSMRTSDPEEKAALRATLAAKTVPQWFGYLEALLAGNGNTGFFVGASMTIADLAVWRLVGWLRGGVLDGIPTTITDGFPLLEAHYTAVDDHPGIRGWMQTHYGK